MQAMIKIVMHAKSGAPLEVMGLMQGKVTAERDAKLVIYAVSYFCHICVMFVGYFVCVCVMFVVDWCWLLVVVFVGIAVVVVVVLAMIFPKEFIIMDAFPLPVEGTETRVNAGAGANEFMVTFTETCERIGTFVPDGTCVC